MLKKVSHIILSVLLLSVTMGLTISKHYCSGELVSTSLFVDANSCCDSDNCCHNENEYLQLDEDYSIVSASEIPESTEFELLDFAVLISNFEIFEIEKSEKFYVSDSPPPPKIQLVLAMKQSYLL